MKLNTNKIRKTTTILYDKKKQNLLQNRKKIKMKMKITYILQHLNNTLHTHTHPFFFPFFLCTKTTTTTTMAELEIQNQNLMPKLIDYLSSLLQRVAEANDINGRFQPQKISVFHGLTRPNISIQSYLERIFKYANCSPCCFVVAYVYLDRFTQCQPSLPINSFNIHRLLITSVMIAAKFMDDM